MIYLPEIDNIYLGVSGVTKIMQGTEQVWPTQYYNQKYTTFRIVGDGTGTIVFQTELSIDIQFSKNGGNWTHYGTSTLQERSVTKGDKVRIKGTNDRYAVDSGGTILSSRLYVDGVDYVLEGNAMSLIYGDSFFGNNILPSYSTHYVENEGLNFYGLFSSPWTSYSMVDCSNFYLPSENLTAHCYTGMFQGLPIQTPPNLGATTIDIQSCDSMFRNCANLTESPVLYATQGAHSAYRNMFSGCTSLSRITCLLIDFTDSTSLSWLEGVSANGVFVKHPDAPSYRSDFWIPDGWIIQDAQI